MLVDAGYLLGAAGTLLAGSPDRGALQTDYSGLVSALSAEAEEQTGMPLLRLLWYDAAFNSQPTQEHRALRVLPDVKVRLGELVKRGERVQQKGVDSYLQRDLTALSRNRAVADVVLLGGDEDLRRALEESQDHGVRVHLWGVEAAAPEYNQSQSLIAEADRRWVIPGEWIRRFIQLREVSPAPVVLNPPPEQADREPQPDPSLTSSPPALGPLVQPPPVATPADLARLAAAFSKDATLPTRPAEGHRGWTAQWAEHDDDLPRLRDLTSARQAWLDNEQDATETTSNPFDVGARFGGRWASRANVQHRAALLERRPHTPRRLDAEMLKYAERAGIDTWEDEVAKFAVRDGFWDAIGADEREELPPAT